MAVKALKDKNGNRLKMDFKMEAILKKLVDLQASLSHIHEVINIRTSTKPLSGPASLIRDSGETSVQNELNRSGTRSPLWTATEAEIEYPTCTKPRTHTSTASSRPSVFDATEYMRFLTSFRTYGCPSHVSDYSNRGRGRSAMWRQVTRGITIL